MPQEKSALKIVFGAASFGAEGTETARVYKVEDGQKILDVFQAHGHVEIDEARIYANGTSEEFLARCGWKERGLAVGTKLYPVPAGMWGLKEGISHSPEDLRKHLDASLAALGTESIDLFYLHAADRNTPFEVTLKGVNDLYKEGKFKRFGLSNFTSYEVAEVVTIAKAKGYVLPTVYQGIYNAVHRGIEPELIPALRKYGIAFYAYSPLGGGFFTMQYRSTSDSVEAGSRFDPAKGLGQNYRSRYWNDTYFGALQTVEAAAKKHSLTLAEVALRWISHHSALKRAHGDAVIIGVSSPKHIEGNLADLEKGPLPEDVVEALDKAWGLVQNSAAPYWH